LKKGYIKRGTSYFYKNSAGQSRHFVLLYGDEVEILEQNSRVKIKHREREGWVTKEHIGDEPVLEVYFIDVGQGDSAFIVTPGRKKILVDGGINNRALQFLAWKYRLSEMSSREKLVIDLLVLSHADEDHINGLIYTLGHHGIMIKEIVHSGIATFKENEYETTLGDLHIDGQKYLVTSHDKLEELPDNKLSDSFLKWKKAIKGKGHIKYRAVSAYSLIDINEPDITIEVLSPRVEKIQSYNKPVYRWFGQDDVTINGNSLVLRLKYGEISFLFSGDLNEDGSKHLMEDESLRGKFDAVVLKAPHHGSQHYHRSWLEAVNPQVTVISSGDQPDYGHPSASFVGTIGNTSRSDNPLIFSTEIASSFEDVGENIKEEIKLSEEELKALDKDTLLRLRKLFKRRLHGMINVRTNGKELCAARRVKASWCWESYGGIAPTPRSVK